MSVTYAVIKLRAPNTRVYWLLHIIVLVTSSNITAINLTELNYNRHLLLLN